MLPESSRAHTNTLVRSKETTVANCLISVTATNLIPVSDETNRTESEHSLVQRAQSGDEQAFATLFQSHKKRVFCVPADDEGYRGGGRPYARSFLAGVSKCRFVPRRLRLFHMVVPGSCQHGADEAAPAQVSADSFSRRAGVV